MPPHGVHPTKGQIKAQTPRTIKAPKVTSPLHQHLQAEAQKQGLAPNSHVKLNGKTYRTDSFGVPQNTPGSQVNIAHGVAHVAHDVYYASPVPYAIQGLTGHYSGKEQLRKQGIAQANAAEDLTSYKEIKHIKQHPIAGGIAAASLFLPGAGKVAGKLGELGIEAALGGKAALSAEDVTRAAEQARQTAQDTTGMFNKIAANRKVDKIRRLRVDPASAHADYARKVEEAQQRAFAKKDVQLLKEGDVTPETGGQAGAQIRAGMKGADRTYQKQRALQKAELRTRVGKLTAEQQKATSLTDLAHARGMEGKYSTLPFKGFENLDPSVQQEIKAHLDTLPMSTLDKKKLAQAIINGVNGEVPKPFERKLIERAYGKIAADKLAAAEPGDIGHSIVDILNIPRAFKTAGDFSWGLRQGFVALAYKPDLWTKELGPMFKSAISEAEATKRFAAIHADPETAIAIEHGLAITDPNAAALGMHEEPYQSQIAERLHELKFVRNIWGVKHVAKAVSAGIRASDRAYVVPLNEIRLNLFKHLTKLAADNGHVLDDELLHDIADIVNTMTGRGNLGKRLAAHRATINAVFFSPGLMKSRINMLNPYHYYALEPFARAQQLKAAGNLLVMIGMTLFLARAAGAKVTLDPRNSDFGKIRIGNTRVDIGGGMNQYLTLASRIATLSTVSSTSGKVTPLSGKFGGQSVYDVGMNFLDNKTSPVLSEGISLAKQSRFGQPLTPTGELGQMFSPLIAQDMWQIARANGPGEGPGMAAATFLPDLFGVGVQNYSPPKKKSSGSSGSSSYFGGSSGSSGGGYFDGSSSSGGYFGG